MNKAIPVLDASAFLAGDEGAQQTFPAALRAAFETYGFVTLEGHGLGDAGISETYKAAESFFGLPVERKLTVSKAGVGGNFGYTPFGQEHAKDDARADLKEFYHFAQTHYDQPECADVPAFASSGRALYGELENLAARLLEAVALSLDLDRGYFTEFVNGGNSILRVLHYPPAPDAPDDAPRAGSHEDINLITLLCESTDEGLELLQRDGSWRPIHALEGHIIVDTGDMMQNLTNGYLKSTRHRVTNPDNDRSRRFSMPFFVHPRAEVSLSPLAKSIARSQQPKSYDDWTAGEYLAQRLAEIGLESSG